jgi:uncharacterized protein (TIRG00374 family)
MNKKIVWLLFAWLLAPLLVWWAARDIRFADIQKALQQLGGAQILILVVLNLTIILITSSGWWLILRAQGYPVRPLWLVGYRLVSFGISYFTLGPQMGGEPAQVYYLQSRHGIPTSTALASVSLDKILELLANFAYLLLGMFAALETGLINRLSPTQAVLWMAVPFTLLMLYTVGVWRGKTPLAVLLKHLPHNRGRIARIVHAVAAAEEQIGLSCQQNPGTVLAASALAALNWAVMTLEYWLVLRFLGLPVSIVQAVAALTAARIAFLIPLPAGLGTLEASQVLAMTAFGFGPALGLSASLIIRARDITVGSLGLLWAGVLSRRGAVKALPTQAIE